MVFFFLLSGIVQIGKDSGIFYSRRQRTNVGLLWAECGEVRLHQSQRNCLRIYIRALG